MSENLADTENYEEQPEPQTEEDAIAKQQELLSAPTQPSQSETTEEQHAAQGDAFNAVISEEQNNAVAKADERITS